MLFAGAGYNVTLFDEKPEQIEAALADIRDQLETHEKNGMLRGTLTSGEQCSLIVPAKSLAECVSGAVHVQVIGSSLGKFISTSNNSCI